MRQSNFMWVNNDIAHILARARGIKAPSERPASEFRALMNSSF